MIEKLKPAIALLDKYQKPYDVVYTNFVETIIYEDNWQVTIQVEEGKIIWIPVIREFAKNVKDKNYDDAVKHVYGKSLGILSRALYSLISELSYKHGIFVIKGISDRNNFSKIERYCL